MQELLGRIARLDPSASLGLRVIACFDELIVGNVNTRALLSAAASLAGCTAGFRRDDPPRTMRVTQKGELAHEPVPHRCADATAELSDGIAVWLEREGKPMPNDAIILERLALAIRIRYGRGVREVDNRRHLGVLTERATTPDERLAAASALGLVATHRYRVVAAPLFAVWHGRPAGPEDVIGTPSGPIHAVVVPEGYEPFTASPCGIGVPATIDALDRSFRTAVVALRLCVPPEEPMILADTYSGLVELLAEAGDDAHHGDANALDKVAQHAWGIETVSAIVTTQSVREAARLLNIHHSTLHSRLQTISAALGFNPLEGFGRTRLGTAFLLHRLRNSTVLALPPPG
ncbi:helix-turn-helix domain-containing protein [Amycolatopsis sp. SID8362]|uniref:helix-turn-helix domain-containing protein n=1 Tax=Amycolatopsis sp. SID8362 TaxID=2690346 RepID=UPI00136AC180|nr:helix-turn-helix domain-containing protein [Amycolatopsis sp. SID8362]NBH02572.1 PucR family transcriptional regulator [Amycolatopsis sp. SID8362]NED39274.1 PucR family transcriptional regulator [Amycolatopsis sp. SID8362]